MTALNLIKYPRQNIRMNVLLFIWRDLSEDSSPKILTLDNMNPYIKEMIDLKQEKVGQKATALEKELAAGVSHPFKEVLRADILDPQALNQPYLSYARKIVALVCYRPLFRKPEVPNDVKRRARYIIKQLTFGSVGSDTNKLGLSLIRKNVANFISRRDKIPCNKDNIYLCAGTTDGFRSFIKLLNCKVNDLRPAILLPDPHFTLYAAHTDLYGMKHFSYYLDGTKNWEISLQGLKSAVDVARKVANPRAIVVMNPNVVTGTVLSLTAIREIIKFAYNERLIIIADETYQRNIYTRRKHFVSFRKGVLGLGSPYKHQEVISIMSTSEAYLSECGIRSASVELLNLKPEIVNIYFNLTRVFRHPSTIGQILMEVLVNPPGKKDDSYKEFMKDVQDISKSLNEKAALIVKEINSIQGLSCKSTDAGLCVLVRIQIPEKAIQAANEKQEQPDEFFALKLLAGTGICVIPCSYLGYMKHFHICMTILPEINTLKSMINQLGDFYLLFVEIYK